MQATRQTPRPDQWHERLALVGDDDRLVASAGILPIRLLAERLGLRAALSDALARDGFNPHYDRGQLFLDLALVRLLGGEAIHDFQALRHLAPVIGPVPSNPTVWRALDEIDDDTLGRVHRAIAGTRRHWYALLEARPEGFPWVRVAGQPLTGITVIDTDASIVFAVSDQKENCAPTYKGGVGFCPIIVTCDNTGDRLVIEARPGNATSNDADDNIAALALAISRLPANRRRRVLFRVDGAGFSHTLLEYIAKHGGHRTWRWEFSVGWACTQRELDALDKVKKEAWSQAIEQDGTPVEDTYVAELTGLLDLSEWTGKVPGLRIIVRDEPLHPKYTKRASDLEKARGRRYQLIAVNARTGQHAWLDARHRAHAHVEDHVKQDKALGLERWPSKFWKINVVWVQLVLLAAMLLAIYRLLLLPAGTQRDAELKTLRFRLFDLPARLTRGQRKIWLHLRADWPWLETVLTTWDNAQALPTPTWPTGPPAPATDERTLRAVDPAPRRARRTPALLTNRTS